MPPPSEGGCFFATIARTLFLCYKERGILCCKDNVEECCGAKISYADEIIKLKLVSGLSDMYMKEDALSLEASMLEEIVKAMETKESAKEANRTLCKGKLGTVSELAIRRACPGCGSKEHGHTRENRRRKCPNAKKKFPNCQMTGNPAQLCRKPPTGKMREVKEEVLSVERA